MKGSNITKLNECRSRSEQSRYGRLFLYWLLVFLFGCVSGPPVPPTETTDPAIVSVYYATDRAVEPSSSGQISYSGLRGDGSLAFGIAEVGIPPKHVTGLVETQAWWRLEFSEDPERHIAILSARPARRQAFIGNIEASLRRSSKQTVLIFVHGYNVAFDDALRRSAQLSFDLQFRGMSLLYSWPSEGSPMRYTVDETNIAWTADHLRRFLRLVLAESGAEKVHVVAHSMGGRALVEALNALDWDSLPDGSARLDQVVLAAPDIDAGEFLQLAPGLRGLAGRYTLYASSRDSALTASRRVHGYPRAGESGENLLVIDGIDTIDASLVETDFFGHSYYRNSQSIISDLFNLIHYDTPPSERTWLQPRMLGDSRYWLFQR